MSDQLDDHWTDACMQLTDAGNGEAMTDETLIPLDETMQLFDPQVGEDYFDDGDLAAPEPLPTGVRYLGVVSVDVAQAVLGAFRKVEGKLGEALRKKGDYRTEIPQITLNFKVLGVAGMAKGFPEEKNYLLNAKTDFWVGKPDKGGRNQLARLIISATGKTEEEVKGLPIRESAKALEQTYVTFEVVHTEGSNGGKFQNPKKIKAATVEEVAAAA